MLGVAIVKGTARVSIAVILAVDHSALHGFLNLMGGGEKKHLNYDSSRQQNMKCPS